MCGRLITLSNVMEQQMIESMDVWHGPVSSFFAHEVQEKVGDAEPVHIHCSESSINSVEEALRSWNIIDDDPTVIWFHDLQEWKADDVNKAIRSIKKHDDPYRVIVTMTSKPLKIIKDESTSIRDFQAPDNKRAYAAQISDWLLGRGRGVEKSVAAKLVDYCQSDPAAAQRVAVTLASFPEGKAITWEMIQPLAHDYVKEIKPFWELSEHLSAGDTDSAIAVLRSTDVEPFGILKYIENRYRMMTLVVGGARLDDLREFNPKAGKWLIDSIKDESVGMTMKDCTLALNDIQNAASMALNSGGGAETAKVAVEHLVIKLSARHTRASR